MAVLNPFNLTSGYTINLDCPYLGREDNAQFKIITSDTLLIMQKVMPPIFGIEHIPGFSVEQIELPLSASKWLADSIENKLWKSAAQGGLPSGTHSYAEYIEGEELVLYRQMNVETANQKGFLLTNFNRPSPIFDDVEYQDFYLTDWMLIDGKLLDFLKAM